MNNVNGILLIIGSMAAFSLEDMFIKHLSIGVSTGQIMIVLGLFCGLVFVALSLATRKRIFDPLAWRGLPLARGRDRGNWRSGLCHRAVSGRDVHCRCSFSGDAAGGDHGGCTVSG